MNTMSKNSDLDRYHEAIAPGPSGCKLVPGMECSAEVRKAYEGCTNEHGPSIGCLMWALHTALSRLDTETVRQECTSFLLYLVDRGLIDAPIARTVQEYMEVRSMVRNEQEDDPEPLKVSPTVWNPIA